MHHQKHVQDQQKMPKPPHKHLINKVISIDSFRLPKYLNRIPQVEEGGDSSAYSVH